MRIIETIDGVHRIEDWDEDPVAWLEANDAGVPQIVCADEPSK